MDIKDGMMIKVNQKSIQDHKTRTMKRLIKSLNPVTKMFWLIGIDMRLHTEVDQICYLEDQKLTTTGFCGLRNVLTLMHVFFGIPLTILCLVSVFEMLRTGLLLELDLGESAISIQSMSNLFMSIVTYSTMVYRQQKLVHFITTLLRDIANHLHPKDVVKVCRRITVISYGLCLITAMYLVALCKVSLLDYVELSMANAVVEKYSNMSWFIWLDKDSKTSIFIISECFNGFFLTFMGMIIIAMFCIILVLLTIQLDHLVFIPIGTEKNQENVATHHRLKEFILRHSEICTFFNTTNREFTFMLFTWITSKVLGMTFLLRAMALDKTNSSSLLFTLHVIAFLVICAFSIAANDKLVNSLQHVGSVVKHEECVVTQEEMFEARTNFQLYCTRVMVSAPKISAWGFFDIDKEFLVAVFGTVLTYVLLLYDKGTKVDKEE